MASVQVQNLANTPDGTPLVNKNTGNITFNWNQWFTNVQLKINTINSVLVQISGAGTTTGAFNTLSPLTTNGDILTYNTGNNSRLGIGTTGQVLTVVGGLPAWATPAASSPLTTKGDLYTFSTVGARLPVGIDGQVLAAASGQSTGLQWVSPGTPTLPLTTKGDTLGYSTVPARVPVGADGQIYTADSTNPLGVSWKNLPSVSLAYRRAFPIQEILSVNSSSSSKSITLPVPPTAGNVLIITLAMNSNTSITSIVQTNVTWASLVGSTGTVPTVAIWRGIVGGSPGSSVTITYGATGYNAFWIGEFSGISGTLNTSSVSASITGVYTTGIITPTVDSLIISAIGTDNGTNPFVPIYNIEIFSGIIVCPKSYISTVSSVTAVGSLLTSAYHTSQSTGVMYGQASGHLVTVIAAIT